MPWAGWGIAVNLPAPSNAADNPLPFDQLKFNLLGLYDLRQRLGVFPTSRGVFTQHQQRFLASDVVWFAAGCHNDGNHMVNHGHFHEMFKAAREGASYEERTGQRKKVLELLFDIATMSDRAYGGSTLIIHVDGTLAPNAPPLPKYIKADIYLPPPLLAENLVSPISIARTVQQFIEDIAVPTAIRWKNAGSITPGLLWKFKDSGRATIPPAKNPDSPLIPPPVTDTSSHRVFLGRPFGSLRNDMAAPNRSGLSPPPSPPSSPPPPPSFPPSPSSPGTSVDYDVLVNKVTQISYLEEEITELAAKDRDSQAVIRSLRDEIKLLTLCLSTTMSELGALRKGKRTGPSPPVFQLPLNFPAHPGSPSKTSISSLSSVTSTSPSACLRPHTPMKGELAPGLQTTVAASPKALVHRPIKSFGPASTDAIAMHGLSHVVHLTLYRVCNEFTMEAWHGELLKLYPEGVVADLVVAMQEDVGNF